LKKWLVGIAAFGYFGACVLLVAGLGVLWYRSDPAPEQPIAFPHTVHAGQLQMPCTYCHTFVERSRHAGAPPLEICMGCHRSIATKREAIRTLTRHFEEKRPVQWKRVYALPDFIYFSHKRHVTAGVACAACHGNVAGMKRVRRVNVLEMGWCVSCHRVRGASRDCATCHK
jgi:Cytochrome c7 and related cytochrome c